VSERFFRRPWHETRGDQYDSWGASTWYFEVGDDGRITRQVECYAHGPSLRYSDERPEDEYGALGEGVMDEFEDWSPWAIAKAEFEEIWEQATS
jgi:hypothetical protein